MFSRLISRAGVVVDAGGEVAASLANANDMTLTTELRCVATAPLGLEVVPAV